MFAVGRLLPVVGKRCDRLLSRVKHPVAEADLSTELTRRYFLRSGGVPYYAFILVLLNADR
jgi:hypothetical protein